VVAEPHKEKTALGGGISPGIISQRFPARQSNASRISTFAFKTKAQDVSPLILK